MNRIAPIVCFLIGLALFSYTVLRAFNIGFTHDESYSYLYASQDSFMEIISNRTQEISPNNHILNTLFMKLFDNISSSEFSLRFQSLIAHILYMSFTFLILKRFNSPLLLITGFLILNLNPYLLDFFSLARGYALSIAFMVMSFHYFLLYLQEMKNKNLIFSLVAACLAILSNFALLNFLTAMLIIHQVWLFIKFRSFRTNLVKSRIVFVTVIILGVILYEPVRKLIKYKRFDFGGYDGIWKNTVGSEIEAFFYGQNYAGASLFRAVSVFVLITLLVYSCIILSKVYKRKVTASDHIGIVAGAALFLILFINILQHKIMGTPYIMERFALFITPLYLLVLISLFNILNSGKQPIKYSGIALSIFIAVGMCIHLSLAMNISYASTWKYDAGTKDMIKELEQERAATGRQKIHLGITWLFEPGINFYRTTKKLDWLEKVDRKGVSGEYDYYYTSKEELDSIPAGKKIIRSYTLSESYLSK